VPEPDAQEPENAPQENSAPEEPAFHSAGFRPRRRRNPVPWLIGGAGVLVIVVVIVLVTTMTGDDADTSTPQGLAEAAVNTYNLKDAEGLAQLLCVKTAVQDTSGMQTMRQAELAATLDHVRVVGPRATAVIHIDASLRGRHRALDAAISMKQLGDHWCISAISPQ